MKHLLSALVATLFAVSAVASTHNMESTHPAEGEKMMAAEPAHAEQMKEHKAAKQHKKHHATQAKKAEKEAAPAAENKASHDGEAK